MAVKRKSVKPKLVKKRKPLKKTNKEKEAVKKGKLLKIKEKVIDVLLAHLDKNLDYSFIYNDEEILVFKKIKRTIRKRFNKSIFTPYEKFEDQQFIIPIAICIEGLKDSDYTNKLKAFGVDVITVKDASELLSKLNEIN